ncbi:10359_t:CDS:1, partial [Racocetra persica]
NIIQKRYSSISPPPQESLLPQKFLPPQTPFLSQAHSLSQASLLPQALSVLLSQVPSNWTFGPSVFQLFLPPFNTYHTLSLMLFNLYYTPTPQFTSSSFQVS